jgi:hypothetical protein
MKIIKNKKHFLKIDRYEDKTHYWFYRTNKPKIITMSVLIVLF